LSSLKKIQPAGIFIAVDREELSKEDMNMLKNSKLIVFKIVTIKQIFEYLLSQPLITKNIWNNFERYISQYGGSD